MERKHKHLNDFEQKYTLFPIKILKGKEVTIHDFDGSPWQKQNKKSKNSEWTDHGRNTWSHYQDIVWFGGNI